MFGWQFDDIRMPHYETALYNFVMNICGALAAYCLFDSKQETFVGYVEKSRLLELF